MTPAIIVLGEDITYTWSFSGNQPTHAHISLSAGCKYNDDGPCKYNGSLNVLANESPYTWTTAGWDLDYSVSWGPSWPSLSGYIESADASGRDGGCSRSRHPSAPDARQLSEWRAMKHGWEKKAGKAVARFRS